MSEHIPLDMCAKGRFRSACACTQADQNLHSVPRMQGFFMQTMKAVIRLIKSAIRAASQLPGRGSTDVDVAPVPAC